MSTSPNEDAVPERQPTSYAVPAPAPVPEAPAAPPTYEAPSYPAPPAYGSSPFASGSEQSSAPTGYGVQQPPSGYVSPAQQQPYYQSPPASPYNPGQSGGPSEEGKQAAKLSLIFGIIGLIIFGLVFSPLALWQASKAEKLGVPATAGKVLGYIGLSFVALYLVFMLMGLFSS